ncbi:recombinase [Desulfurivibrio sp. D14AmB]|uniref:recombinase n=1 Tax=Desulfurivibrio sp. D14AmB TaxID=3374370 RepID=UPI00376F099F
MTAKITAPEKVAETEQQKQAPGRLSWEEIVERKMKMAQERNTLQMRGNSPLGFTMHHILRQFDQAYARFKGSLGEIGGISHEEGDKLMTEGREILLRFNELTARLSKKVNFHYKPPRVLVELKGGKRGGKARVEEG